MSEYDDETRAGPRAEPLAGEAPGAEPTAAPPRRTRTGAAFRALVFSLVVLVLLLVFILENTQRVKVSYFGASGHLALGIALLLAAVGGALVTALLGAARILQLRRDVRKRRVPPS